MQGIFFFKNTDVNREQYATKYFKNILYLLPFSSVETYISLQITISSLQAIKIHNKYN